MAKDHSVEERRFALGLGLTSACNLSCAFCYRETMRDDRLTLEQVQAALAALPVRSVNLGTGESGTHPEFPRILEWLAPMAMRITASERLSWVASLPSPASRTVARAGTF
jgi:MoaA/NifB/PqqE/SkfB family radical SAM enzyme